MILGFVGCTIKQPAFFKNQTYKKETMALVEIKQNPHNKTANTVGLNKYMRSKMPNTWEVLYAGKARDGRWLTGIDEDSLDVRSIKDETIRTQRIEEVKAVRENLERETGYDLSAKPTNPFWRKFVVKIGQTTVLDLDVALDVIKYHFLLANGDVAPELAVASAPEYATTKYYLSRSDEEQTNLAFRKQEKDSAIAKLFGLRENKNRLFLVGRYLLGREVKEESTLDTLYNKLSDFISNPVDTKNSNARRFISIADKPVEELQYTITGQKAIETGVIRSTAGQFYHGSTPLGKTLNDVAVSLADPRNSMTYNSIVEEIEEKRLFA